MEEPILFAVLVVLYKEQYHLEFSWYVHEYRKLGSYRETCKVLAEVFQWGRDGATLSTF
jgi:hypothetical protein